MTELRSGDFVVVTGSSAFAGKIARLLYRAPGCEFRLPDGHTILAARRVTGCWSLPRKCQPFCVAARRHA